MCKVIRSNTEIAADCLILPKFGTEFYQVTGDTLQMFMFKDQRLRSQLKVMYQQQKKRYNMATNKLRDLKLGMQSQLKWKRTGAASNGLKLQCKLQCSCIAMFSTWTFLLGVKAETLQADIDWKSAFLKRRGQFGTIFEVEGVVSLYLFSC